MADIIDCIEALPNLLKLIPATENQIAGAEQQLSVRFSEDYKEYLRKFGAIVADGIELSGIARSDYRNVVTLTKKEWDINPGVDHTMYVIEDTHIDGIVIWQDHDGHIYQTHPFTKPQKISESLAAYIASHRG